MPRATISAVIFFRFLLGAAGLYADNPFIGAWTDAGNETIAVSADTVEISGTDEPEKTYPYTFDAKTITIGPITWLYIAAEDGSAVYLLTWGVGRPIIIIWYRAQFQQPGKFYAE